MWQELGAFFTRGSRLDRVCYLIAAVLFASGLVHLVLQLATGGSWIGPLSMRKPITFGVAFGLTLATITWVTTFIRIRPRLRGGLLAVFALACIAEVAVITLQQWRGVPSHFNVVTTPLNSALSFVAAGGGGLLVVLSVVFAIAAFLPNPVVPQPMRIAVRAGFVAFLSALAIGAVMIAIGVAVARSTGSLGAAYAMTAAFKSGHAATMHGILIMPMLAWLGRFTGWPERRRRTVVLLGCAGYLLTAGVVVVDTFIAVNPIAPQTAPVLTTVLSAGGLAALLTAGVLTIAAVARHGQNQRTRLPRRHTAQVSGTPGR